MDHVYTQKIKCTINVHVIGLQRKRFPLGENLRSPKARKDIAPVVPTKSRRVVEAGNGSLESAKTEFRKPAKKGRKN